MATVRLTERGRHLGRKLLMEPSDTRGNLFYYFTSTGGKTTHHMVSVRDGNHYRFDTIVPPFEHVF